MKRDRARTAAVLGLLRANAPDQVRASTALDKVRPLELADSTSAEARAAARAAPMPARDPRVIRHG